MRRNTEIFRGAGAMAALEAATIRAALDAEGIPYGGEPMRVTVKAGDYARARRVVAVLCGLGDEGKEKDKAAGSSVGITKAV